MNVFDAMSMFYSRKERQPLKHSYPPSLHVYAQQTSIPTLETHNNFYKKYCFYKQHGQETLLKKEVQSCQPSYPINRSIVLPACASNQQGNLVPYKKTLNSFIKLNSTRHVRAILGTSPPEKYLAKPILTSVHNLEVTVSSRELFYSRNGVVKRNLH